MNWENLCYYYHYYYYYYLFFFFWGGGPAWILCHSHCWDQWPITIIMVIIITGVEFHIWRARPLYSAKGTFIGNFSRGTKAITSGITEAMASLSIECNIRPDKCKQPVSTYTALLSTCISILLIWTYMYRFEIHTCILEEKASSLIKLSDYSIYVISFWMKDSLCLPAVMVL